MTNDNAVDKNNATLVEDFWNDLGRPLEEPLDLSQEPDNGVHYMLGRDIAGDSQEG
jgi:hypothetical protein